MVWCSNFDGHPTAPLRFQWRHVHNDAATGIRAVPNADAQHPARDFHVLDRLSQGETVRRNDALVRFDIHERFRIEILGIDRASPDVRKDFELAADADVVAVAGHTVGDDPGAVLLRGERLDLDIALDHPIGKNAHECIGEGENRKIHHYGACACACARGGTSAGSGWRRVGVTLKVVLVRTITILAFVLSSWEDGGTIEGTNRPPVNQKPNG